MGEDFLDMLYMKYMKYMKIGKDFLDKIEDSNVWNIFFSCLPILRKVPLTYQISNLKSTVCPRRIVITVLQGAAQRFQEESGVQADVELDHMDNRIKIRDDIQVHTGVYIVQNVPNGDGVGDGRRGKKIKSLDRKNEKGDGKSKSEM